MSDCTGPKCTRPMDMNKPLFNYEFMTGKMYIDQATLRSALFCNDTENRQKIIKEHVQIYGDAKLIQRG